MHALEQWSPKWGAHSPTGCSREPTVMQEEKKKKVGNEALLTFNAYIDNGTIAWSLCQSHIIRYPMGRVGASQYGAAERGILIHSFSGY